MNLFTEHRGPAKYFHGREEIIDPFIRTVEHYRSFKRGTTFLIKGPPGSGKTALLYKLGEIAKDSGYKVIDNVRPMDLHDPEYMAKRLGVCYTVSYHKSVGVNLKLLHREHGSTSISRASVTDVIKEASNDTVLILVLDEAQHLADLVSPQQVKATATLTLNLIHNGKVGCPVFLLAGGLGTTEVALKDLGISRIEDVAKVRLGSLSKDATVAVIEDHLRHRFGMDPPPAEWVKSLAAPTHGWPHHIMCYIEAARVTLGGGTVPTTHEALAETLKRGTATKETYYQTRSHGIEKKQRAILAHLFAKQPSGGTVDKSDITTALEAQYTPEAAEAVFTRALKQGVLDERADGGYAIPIPSMQSWLIEEYGRDKGYDKGGRFSMER